MKKDFGNCPLLIAAWISHYGSYDNAGEVGGYCTCGDDCAWFDDQSEYCAIFKIAKMGIPK